MSSIMELRQKKSCVVHWDSVPLGRIRKIRRQLREDSLSHSNTRSWVSAKGSEYEGAGLILATTCHFWLEYKQETSTGLREGISSRPADYTLQNKNKIQKLKKQYRKDKERCQLHTDFGGCFLLSCTRRQRHINQSDMITVLKELTV